MAVAPFTFYRRNERVRPNQQRGVENEVTGLGVTHSPIANRRPNRIRDVEDRKPRKSKAQEKQKGYVLLLLLMERVTREFSLSCG